MLLFLCLAEDGMLFWVGSACKIGHLGWRRIQLCAYKTLSFQKSLPAFGWRRKNKIELL